MLPQLKMIVVIIFILGLTCGGGQQIPPPEGNTLILMNVIDTLDSLSLQLKEFEEKVEAKFEEVQANVTGITETQKTIQADIKQVQANVTGIIETQKTIQADIKQVQANVTGIIETQKTIQADIKLQETTLVAKIEGLQQCSTEAQLSQFQELVFKDPCEDGSHTCSDMSTCTDYFNRYECSCLPGYSGDGFTCQDVDECSENNNICGDHETCQNSPGSYTCACDKYFRYVGNICQGPVCEWPSLFIPEIGCLTFVREREMRWDESKSKCQEMGLRLAEGIQRRHFQALKDHFYPLMGYDAAWIGFRHRQWLNQEEEEEIKEEEWHEGQPNGGLEECGYIRLHSSYLSLGDFWCSGSFYPLCQSLP